MPMLTICRAEDLSQILTTARSHGLKAEFGCCLEAHGGIRAVDFPFLRMGHFDLREGMIRHLNRREFSRCPSQLAMTEGLERRLKELMASEGFSRPRDRLFPEPDWNLRLRHIIRSAGIRPAVELCRSYRTYSLRRVADRLNAPDPFGSSKARRGPPLVRFDAVTREAAEAWFAQ